MRVLVTGGAGYIGSHCCVELLNAGHQVVVLDNLVNSKPEALRRVQAITGRRLTFIQGDCRDQGLLASLFRTHRPEAVLHFAGLKAVGESVSRPLEYYDCNVGGTLALCRVMGQAGVRRLVFSSSATVYGEPAAVPVREDFPLHATNPYGQTKLVVEDLLRALVASDPDWSIALLRYFNPVGAHPSGSIGEDPRDTPNNLMPVIAQVAVGRRPELLVFGDDYPTPDGTGVRDYIHVIDLVRGHLAALERLPDAGLLTCNLGTGRGLSVLELVSAFARISGRAVPWRVVGRRPGDVASIWADPSLAQELLGWRAELGLEDMIRDTWRWQCENPAGYP